MRQSDRIFQFHILRHVAQNELQIGDIFSRGAIFTGGQSDRRLVSGVIEVISLDAFGLGIFACIHVQRDEQIGIFLVC